MVKVWRPRPRADTLFAIGPFFRWARNAARYCFDKLLNFVFIIYSESTRATGGDLVCVATPWSLDPPEVSLKSELVMKPLSSFVYGVKPYLPIRTFARTVGFYPIENS